MAEKKKERVLILAKTYPSPSTKYSETSCVAGINEKGEMRRLFPVPFRLLEEGSKFKKWQWIDVLLEKAPADHRPESHRIYVDTIKCLTILESSRNWISRMPWIDKIPSFSSYDEMDLARENEKISLALLRPKKISALIVSEADRSDWTEEEKRVLLQAEMQGNLFSEDEAKQSIIRLRKLPYDFYYQYVCDTSEGEKLYKHKITDWEAGGLFWTCQRDYGKSWEEYFRKMLTDRLSEKNLMFLMGNQHRFQDQWLIISLIYPPKQKPDDSGQGLLLF